MQSSATKSNAVKMYSYNSRPRETDTRCLAQQTQAAAVT